jgi:hypothetical protein
MLIIIYFFMSTTKSTQEFQDFLEQQDHEQQDHDLSYRDWK